MKRERKRPVCTGAFGWAAARHVTREEIKYKEAESPAGQKEAFITRFPGNGARLHARLVFLCRLAVMRAFVT